MSKRNESPAGTAVLALNLGQALRGRNSLRDVLAEVVRIVAGARGFGPADTEPGR